MERDLHDWRDHRPKIRRPITIIGPSRWWIVCNRIEWVTIHWTGERTIPCDTWKGHESCQLCKEDVPKNVEHWILVQDHRARMKPTLLKLTSGAIESSKNLGKYDGDLYSRLLFARRATASIRSKMLAEIEDTDELPNLVQVQEVIPTLLRLWSAPTKGKGGRYGS